MSMRDRMMPTHDPFAAPYRADEWVAAVLASEPRTAVFDCDGTLWSSDSGYGFMRWSLEQELVSAERRAWMEDRYRLYEAGAVDEATICGEMVKVYAGLSVETLRAAARSFVQAHIEPHIFPEMLSLVRALQAAGTEIWAVSSTAAVVVEAALRSGERAAWGIPAERILGTVTRAQVGAAADPDSSDILTDDLLAVLTGEAKAEALRAHGLAHPDAVFGNSVHDAAMLSIARHAYPVNPSVSLLTMAAERGWRVFQPGSRTGGL